MTVAQSAKETEAEGLRCAQPEGEASNMRASEDILERAKTSLKRHDPINQGFYTSMPPEDVQIWKELIAEVEAKRNLALDMLTKNKDLLDRAMRAEAEVERLRSQLEESQIKYGVDIASTDLHWQDEIAAKDARIKGLEGLCVGACMEAGWTDEEIREALERIKSNEKL